MIEVYAEDEALTAEEEQCIRTACETALEMEGAAGDITVLVAGPDHIQQLNRDFRNVAGSGVRPQPEPGAGLSGGPRHPSYPGIRPYERGGGAGHARPPADYFGKDR